MSASRRKIVVLDDDPTGSQTVHGCLLLLRWDVKNLMKALQDASPIFFILTNTRSMQPQGVTINLSEVCNNLKIALANLGNPEALIVSRSDSTLRGHYPLESDIIAHYFGPFDAHFLVPAFIEGGRITHGGTHFVVTHEGDQTQETPVHQTEFARGPSFSFNHSFLPNYIEEKTSGKVVANHVDRIQVEALRGDRQPLVQRLLNYRDYQYVAVDGETQQDLDAFAIALEEAQAIAPKRYLFRSAASLLTSLANLPPQAIASENMGHYRRSDRPGIIIIGSYTQKTTEQLNHLLQQPKITGLEIPIEQLTTANLSHHSQTLHSQIHHHWHQNHTPVLYTSRTPAPQANPALITQLITQLIQTLPTQISYLISKGGITTNNTLTQSLNLTTVRLLGQIIPGVSLITTPNNHPQYPNLPVVTFPGNVGISTDLTETYQRLTAPRESQSQLDNSAG